MTKQEHKMRNECVCPVCGKTFFAAPYHVYAVGTKRGRVYACSWSCVLKNERKVGKSENQT